MWLARFKATLGFLELAAALKFLSNADQVWDWRIITQPVLLAAWAIIFLCAALYLFGLLRFGVVAETEPANAPVPLSRRLTASAFALATVYCFWGLAGRPISPYVGAFLPAPGYGGVAQAAENTNLPWLTDYQTALAQAKAENKPLLIDFTGVTCTNCRLNEKNIFPRASVQAALPSYVRVQLYTDRGARDLPNQQLQQAKFGDVALPLYGVIDPQTEAARGKTEGVQTVAGFARFLAQNSSPTVSAGDVGMSAQTPAWAAYSPNAIVQAGKIGKPTIVDFTAKWCVNCKEIEHDVFENPAVAPTLARSICHPARRPDPVGQRSQRRPAKAVRLPGPAHRDLFRHSRPRNQAPAHYRAPERRRLPEAPAGRAVGTLGPKAGHENAARRLVLRAAFVLVEIRGLEPLTYSLRTNRSPS